MTNRYSNPRISFLPLFLVTLALALNLHDLAADSFWGDEIFTAIFASQSPAEVIRWTANDIHPPLYYLLAGTFTRLTVPLGATELPTSVSDWLWRFPSVIFTILTVAVTYRLAYHVSRILALSKAEGEAEGTYHVSRTTHHAHLTANAAALLLCLAPIAIKYGQETRMHALFMFLSALSTWLFFRVLARPQQWSRWLAFALATTANIYTMYFGFLILAAQAGLLLFLTFNPRFTQYEIRTTHYAPRARLIGFSTAIILAFLLYVPWWPVLFNILRKRAAVGAIEGGVGNPLNFTQGVVRALGPSPEPAAWLFLLLFIIGLIFLAHRHWPLVAFAALWLTLPTALPIVLGDPRALQFRYAFVLPIYLTVIAYAVVNMSAIGRWNSEACHFEERSNEKSPVYSVAKRHRGNASLPAGAQTCPEPCPERSRRGSRRNDINKHALTYILWLLATLSFIATLGIYAQTKPDWRSAAAYLDAHAAPADIILIGPLWDEGRFIGYYYRGQAQILTPAAMVTNIEPHVEMMRANGGRVWAVNRFAPAKSLALQNIVFPGVVLSEPQLTVYEPELLTKAALDLAAQAVDAAYPWAAEAEAQGVLNPDPRTARAAALLAWGDVLVAAGRPEEALAPYQTAVDIFPGWVDGFIALAETHEVVGNLSAAAGTYRQAIAFNLKWQGPQADEAAALVEAGQWEMALEKYHQIIGE